jgi:2,3-dihydroxybiphenyl 1,2-dioxygenase
MEHELELGYLIVEVPDPSTLDEFFCEAVGLAPGTTTDPEARAWRNDDKAARVVVTPGPANDATAVGFEATDAAALDRILERLRSTGHDVHDDADMAGERGVERLVRVAAPWGVSVEIVVGMPDADSPYDNPAMPGGWLTDDVGFGHVVFATTDFDETHRFLTDGLGLRQSDWLGMEIAEGIELEVHFYHCNQRHHTVAIAKAPFEMPQRLHHIMFETRDRDDVGAAFDRVWSTELAIPNGLGKHDNDGMFSFYVASPAGFQVEIGHGARVITDDWDDDRRYDRISAWGHQPLRG